MEVIELEQLERWMIRRTQRAKKQQQSNENKNGRKTSLSRWKFCVHADKRQMLQDLTYSLQLRPTKTHVLWELASCICSAVNADGFRLYICDGGEGSDSLSLCVGNNIVDEKGEFKMVKVKSDSVIATYVAKTRDPIRLSRGDNDKRFPEELLNKGEMGHVMCQAIVFPDGNLVAVLELWRKFGGPPFHEEDEEIGCSYLVWGGIALHYAHMFMTMSKQRKLNEFLLAVVK